MPKTKKIKAWAGMYGGHYDVIVFFKKKPPLSKEPYYNPNIIDGKYYDLIEARDLGIIIGSLCLPDFKEHYPDADITPYLENERPKGIEIVEVFQIEIEGALDEWGHFRSLVFNVDGY